MPSPIVLSVAGSDSSGAAGLQADVATFAALGVQATTAVTLLTAQNARGIDGFHAVPPAFVARQLDSLLADSPPVATKTGLLRDPAVVDVVAERTPELGRLVIDPVCTAGDGTPIVAPRAIDRYRGLVSASVVCTPNRWEIELLLGAPGPLGFDDLIAAADDIRALGSELMVVTGGRGDDTRARDLLVGSHGISELGSERVAVGHSLRGTGCTFSAAIAAFLAVDETPLGAVTNAHAFVQRQLARLEVDEWPLGDAARRPGVPHVI